MARAIDVARCLVNLAVCEDEPDTLTHLRLQKLLYYCQAWSLAKRDRPLFPEPIEAWSSGPIVIDIYRRFSDQGMVPIYPESFDPEDESEIDPEESHFVVSVWEAYKGFSASKLRDMTHEEDPWIQAREGYGPAQRCEVEIKPEAIRDYFLSGVS